MLDFTTTFLRCAGLRTSSATLSPVGVAAVKVFATSLPSCGWTSLADARSSLPGRGLVIVPYTIKAVSFLFQECSDASMARIAYTDFDLPLEVFPQLVRTCPRQLQFRVELPVYVSGAEARECATVLWGVRRLRVVQRAVTPLREVHSS